MYENEGVFITELEQESAKTGKSVAVNRGPGGIEIFVSSCDDDLETIVEVVDKLIKKYGDYNEMSKVRCSDTN